MTSKLTPFDNHEGVTQCMFRYLRREDLIATEMMAAPPVVMASPGGYAPGDRQFEDLVERNKNLLEGREQLIGKNKLLAEENKKLKAKCQNLEDLLHEEETDINVVLELIKNMQQGSLTNGNASAIGPISKFLDLQKLQRKN